MSVSLFALSSEIDSDFDLLLSDLESTWPWKHCAKIPLEKIDKKVSCDFFDSDECCTFWRSLYVLLSLFGKWLGSEVCSNLILDLVQIYQISWCSFPIIRDMHMSRFAQNDPVFAKTSPFIHLFWRIPPTFMRFRDFPHMIQAILCREFARKSSKSLKAEIFHSTCLGAAVLRLNPWDTETPKMFASFPLPHKNEKRFPTHLTGSLGVAWGVRGSGVSASCLSQRTKKWNIPGDHQ